MDKDELFVSIWLLKRDGHPFKGCNVVMNIEFFDVFECKDDHARKTKEGRGIIEVGNLQFILQPYP